MNYRRKRISGLPPEPTRALDDEFAKLERVTDDLASLQTGVTDLTYTAATRVLESSTGADVTLPLVTTTDAGLASAADKTKLDSLAVLAPATASVLGGVKIGSGINVVADGTISVAAISGTQTDLSVANITTTTLDVESSTGNDATLPAATATVAGLATAAQITKLDGIEAGAVAAGAAGDAFAAEPVLTWFLDMGDYPAVIRAIGGTEVGQMGYSPVYNGPALAYTVAGSHPAGTGGVAVSATGTTIDGPTTFLGNLDLDDLAMVIRNTSGTEVGTLGYSTTWAGPALAHTVAGVHPAGTGGIAVTSAGTTIDGLVTLLGNLDIQDQVMIVRDAGGTAVGQLGFNATYAGLSLGYTVGGVHPAAAGGIAFNSTRTIIDGDVTVTDLAAGPVYADSAGLLYTGAASVSATRLVSTANGLQGGGDLSADRTLSPVYGTTANTVCQGNDARLANPYIVYSSGVQVGRLAVGPNGGPAVTATDSSGGLVAGYGGIELAPGLTRVNGTTVRLESLATGSAKNVLVDASGNLTTGAVVAGTDLSIYGVTTTTVGVASSTGADVLLPAATAAAAGVATAAQITTLNSASQPGHTHTEANITNLDRLKWRGNWAAGTYVKNDLVRYNGRWLAAANKTTTAIPVPIGGVSLRYLYPTDPTWVSVTGSNRYGFRIPILATKTIIQGLRVRIPTTGQCFLDIGNGSAIQSVLYGMVLTGGVWAEFRIPPITVEASTIVDFMIYADSIYKADNFWVSGDNARGFATSTYPPLPGDLTLTRYSIDVVYEQPLWPADWDILGGY